jgi:quercetin dioxygenase-like cupin family protein
MIAFIGPKHSFTYDGAQLNVYHANTGEGLEKHEHLYSHATICHAGSCKVSLEGRSYIINKNSQPLNLPAHEWHEIVALEDETVFVNVFSESKN